MHRTLKNIFTIVSSSLLIANYANAFAPGYVEGRIDRVQTRLDGDVFFYLSEREGGSCGENKTFRIQDANAPGTNRVYSSLLSYQAQGQKVSFYVAACENGVSLINRIEGEDRY